MKRPLPEFGWAVISPWNRRPFVYQGLRFTRRELVQLLNNRRCETKTLGEWRALGWRFVRVKVSVIR